MTEKGPASRLSEKDMSEKVCGRRSVGEGSREKVH